MIWYDDLYVSENIEKKADKIKWKIKHNAGLLQMYVITLACNSQNLLEIISTKELMQKNYPKKIWSLSVWLKAMKKQLP